MIKNYINYNTFLKFDVNKKYNHSFIKTKEQFH